MASSVEFSGSSVSCMKDDAMANRDPSWLNDSPAMLLGYLNHRQ